MMAGLAHTVCLLFFETRSYVPQTEFELLLLPSLPNPSVIGICPRTGAVFVHYIDHIPLINTHMSFFL